MTKLKGRWRAKSDPTEVITIWGPAPPGPDGEPCLRVVSSGGGERIVSEHHILNGYEPAF